MATVVSTLGNKIRTTKPVSTDAGWEYYKKGGINYFDDYYSGLTYHKNKKGQSKQGNCTWYAYGRFMEIQGKGKNSTPPINASPGKSSAGNWRNIVNKSCKTGNKPEAGAVAVFYDPNGVRDGHVMVVEEVYSDGSYLCTDSGWASFYWQKSTTKDFGDGRGQVRSWMGSSPYNVYHLALFIYNPAVHGSSSGNSETGSGGTSSDPDSTAKEYIEWRYKVPQESYLSNGSPTKILISNDDIKNNAICTYIYLRQHGWTIKPISAVLGYLQWYSVFCPITLAGELQTHATMFRPDDEGQAYGLFGWSPSRKLYNFINSKNCKIGWDKNSQGFYNVVNVVEETDAYAQLEFFNEWTARFDDWGSPYWTNTSKYYEGFETFKTDKPSLTNHTTEWLVRCFCDSWNGIDWYISPTAKEEIIDLADSWETYIRGNQILDVYSISPGDGSVDEGDTVSPNPPLDEGSEGAETPSDAFKYTKPNNKHLFVVDGGWI